MLWASVIAAIAHYLLRDIPLPDPVSILLKGAGVALLALWALQQEAGRDSRALALVLGLGALGDMAIEWSLQAGALCFFAGHITAIALYRRHRRPSLTPSQKGAVLALLLLTPVVSLLLTGEVQVGLYALALGGMAAAAWASRFALSCRHRRSAVRRFGPAAFCGHGAAGGQHGARPAGLADLLCRPVPRRDGRGPQLARPGSSS